MKTYSKLISAVALLFLLTSFINIKSTEGDKIIFTKVYVNKSAGQNLHESILIYDNGIISYDRKEEWQSQVPIVQKLTKDQLFKLKKLLHRSDLKYLDKSYKCGIGKSTTGNSLFVINLPSIKKKIHVQDGCTMPKALKTLDDYLINEIIDKIELNKNQLSAKN